MFILMLCFVLEFVLTFRTDVCLKEHEEFSLCSWKCPPTCVNMRLLSRPGFYCPYKWECMIGCRCSAGYVRDEYTKNCVEISQCPDFQRKRSCAACIHKRPATFTNSSVHLGPYRVTLPLMVFSTILMFIAW